MEANTNAKDLKLAKLYASFTTVIIITIIIIINTVVYIFVISLPTAAVTILLPLMTDGYLSFALHARPTLISS